MNSVRKNYIYNIIYQILAIIIPLITSPYLSRVLGAEPLGIYSYTYSIVLTFSAFSLLGISNYGIRSIARLRNDQAKMSRNFFGIYFLQLIFTAIVLLTYFVYIYFFDQEFKLISLLQVGFLASSLVDVSWFFFGIENFKLTVFRNIVIRVITVILVFVFVKSPSDLWKHTLIMSSGNFATHLFLWLYLPKYLDLSQYKYADLSKHVKPIFYLFIPVLAVRLYIYMDKVMLGILASYSDVGFYYNAEKIVNIPMGFITALGTVMMPRTSFLISKGDKQLVRQNIRKTMNFNLLLSYAMAFGIAGIAKVFAPFFFGQEFVIVGDLLPVISITIIFKAWANVLRTQVLLPNGRDKEFSLSVILGAIFNIIANYIFIPKLGAMGAILGTVAAEGIVSISQTYMVRQDVDVVLYLKESIGYLLAGIIMFFVVKTIEFVDLTSLYLLLIQVISGGFVYILLAFLFSPYKKDLIYSVKSVFKKGDKNGNRSS